MLQEVARQEQSWRAVLAIGAVLDGAYAAAGRWDAWHSCLLATLEAARAVGDQAAEAMALHQLGTGALGRGDLEAAYDLLSGALGIRVALGHTAAAAVTRQNLATITAAPASRRFAVALGRVPTPVKAVAVLLPLLGSLAFVGLAQAGVDPRRAAGSAAARVRRPGRRQGQRTAGLPAHQRRPGHAARRQRRRRRGQPRRVHAGRHELRRRGARRAVGAPRRSCSRPRRRASSGPASPGDPGDPGRPHRADRRHGRGSTAAPRPGGRQPLRARVQRADARHAQRAAAGPRRRGLHTAGAQGGRRAG